MQQAKIIKDFLQNHTTDLSEHTTTYAGTEIFEAQNESYWRDLVEYGNLCISTLNVFEKTAVNSYTVYIPIMS